MMDTRGLSRRSLGRFAAASGIGALLAPAVGSTALAAPAKALPVFDRARVGTTHVLPSTPQTVRSGAFDPSAPTAIRIRSGDVVHYPNTWLHWGNKPQYGMSFAEREPIRKQYRTGPFSLVGPVEVAGAEPGDVIECRMLRLKPIDWGWNSAPLGVGALPEDFDQPYLHYFRFDAARKTTQFAPGVTVALNPIQAVIATEPKGNEPISAILTGDYGGNLLLPELVEGTALFLPVQVTGGRLWTGDSHAAQGDGVVNQTAIETAMEDLRIQYVLHKRVDLQGPVAETATHWVMPGYAESLEHALTLGLRRLIKWLAPASGLSPADIYSLASIAGSFRVTQYAHQLDTNYTSKPAKAVHAMLPKAIFDTSLQARIGASVRPGA